jgi:serine/threonine-protein kinase
MRIEAASFAGKPVYFQLIAPWTRLKTMHEEQTTGTGQVSLAVFTVILLSLLVSGTLLARRNLLQGRGDRRGAFRLAAFVFAAHALAWLFGAHHVPNFNEFLLFMEALVWGLAWSCFIWLLYTALEPYVRRHWPATLVSWSRLLAGDFRDPLVGRDVLLGCFTGASSTAVGRFVWFVTVWLGYPSPQPETGPAWQLLGVRPIISTISLTLIFAPIYWFAGLFLLVLLRALLRKDWAAAVAFVFIGFAFGALQGASVSELLVGSLLVGGLAAFLMTRFGFLPILANFVFWQLLETFPLTTQSSVWYSGISLTGILLMATLAIYAFYTSLGGRPVFGGSAFEE